MVKHTQTTCWQKLTNYFSVFDHFVGLALKGLKSGSSLTTLQGSRIFSELLEKLHKSLIGLIKHFVPFLRKRPERRVHSLESAQICDSRPAALET